ncbi:MAG: DUF4271 domain-containing protein [Mucilaginibacter sp.]
MRLTVFCFLLIWCCCNALYASQDSVPLKRDSSLTQARPRRLYRPVADSAALAQEARNRFLTDSVAMVWLKPDPQRENQFLKMLHKTENPLTDIQSLLKITSKPFAKLGTGELRVYRERWVIAVIIGLLIYTALLNLFLGNDIKIVIQSFYHKTQLDKEGSVINSWAFIGLFLLFSLTLGLVLYQLTIYYGVSVNMTGFQLFISLFVVIGVLMVLKFLILRFIGFVFDVNKLVSEYITILNLTYFNIAFVLLAVATCFSLISGRFVPGLLIFTVTLIAVIFAWQYLRNSVYVISNIRFHKFYLFIYLCALEICPILILIKALNI